LALKLAKTSFTFVPTKVMATATQPAMIPYSIAVTPVRSWANPLRRLNAREAGDGLQINDQTGKHRFILVCHNTVKIYKMMEVAVLSIK
jgi:hypothetical protein